MSALQDIEGTQVVTNSDKNVKNEKTTNLEDIIGELKVTGRYHIVFLSLISFCIIIAAPYTLHYIFSAEDVPYRCKYSECADTEILSLAQNSTIDLKCRKYELLDDNGTCTEDNFNLSSRTQCTQWDYEEPNSFVADFDLGCKDWKRTLVGTMHSSGFMVGLLIIGPFSDKFGRKKLIIFSTLFSSAIGISKSMVKSYWAFIALETLEPVLGDNYATAYIMVAEMMTTKKRPFIVLLFATSDALGAFLMTLLAYLTPNWRIFLLTLYAPSLVAISYIFLLDESPRWLLIKGRKDDAVKVIKKAAKRNKITIDDSKFVNLITDKTSGVNLMEALKVTFSSKALIIRLLLCFCMWITALFNTYALLINSVSLEGNKYINFALVSSCTFFGGTILTLVLTKFQRKVPLIISLVLTGVFCVAQSFLPSGKRWLSITLYLAGKINASMTVKMVYLYTTELFPTYTRNTMLALCSAVGRIGSILAPLTPLLMVYWSNLPAFLVGVLSLLTALIVTLMPDTSKDVLPDNVQQAEALGSNENKK